MERKGMPGGEDVAEVGDALRALGDEARDAWSKLASELEIERRMNENPLPVLGIALGAGFVLGGGLWPALRPFVKAVAKAALSPANLVAIAAAVGAMRAAGEPEEMGAAPAETH